MINITNRKYNLRNAPGRPTYTIKLYCMCTIQFSSVYEGTIKTKRSREGSKTWIDILVHANVMLCFRNWQNGLKSGFGCSDSFVYKNLSHKQNEYTDLKKIEEKCDGRVENARVYTHMMYVYNVLWKL